eukprot:SM000085S23283  [mRNA]  locus=s85:569174:575979:+ [translate_table: standard]
MAPQTGAVTADDERSRAGLPQTAADGGGPAAIARPSIITTLKARKNAAELEGMRQAHLRDAAALAEFWAWLEAEVRGGGAPSEAAVGEALEGFRARQAGFVGTSFDTIAGVGPNGAVIHYRAEPGACAAVDGARLLLLDSGGQYVDGTTDVTRTVHFGAPLQRERECFTRGHIALDRAVFPEGTPGFVLDVLARRPLWSIGLDYRHGTGHGVGAALNVHEGPQGISPRFGNVTGLAAGMVVSNEPGYYEDGQFGIRIEEDTPSRFGGTTFLGFERLTYVPIQLRMIDESLMTPEEVEWLNDYHADVFRKVSPLVSGDALRWLTDNTRSLVAAPALAATDTASLGLSVEAESVALTR